MKNKVRHIVIGLMIAALFVFMIVIMMFRQTVNDLGKDPSLNFMNIKASFEVAVLINKNKNKFADQLDECWNQKNPLLPCSPENKIEEGDYMIRGIDQKWLDRTESFEIPEEQLRGWLDTIIADRVYYQKIHITYPAENEMKVAIETWNTFGEKVPLEINITK